VNPSRLFIVRPVATALLTADSTVETRRVVVKRTQGSDTVLAAGLKAGEAVVIDGQPRLQQGTKVEVKTAARTPAGGRPQ
jgi:multidrug efflux system membrane fusion protein